MCFIFWVRLLPRARFVIKTNAIVGRFLSFSNLSLRTQDRRMGGAKRYPSIVRRVRSMGFASLYPSYGTTYSLCALAPFARAAALETCGRPVRAEIQREVAKALRGGRDRCAVP